MLYSTLQSQGLHPPPGTWPTPNDVWNMIAMNRESLWANCFETVETVDDTQYGPTPFAGLSP